MMRGLLYDLMMMMMMPLGQIYPICLLGPIIYQKFVFCYFILFIRHSCPYKASLAKRVYASKYIKIKTRKTGPSNNLFIFNIFIFVFFFVCVFRLIIFIFYFFLFLGIFIFTPIFMIFIFMIFI